MNFKLLKLGIIGIIGDGGIGNVQMVELAPLRFEMNDSQQIALEACS